MINKNLDFNITLAAFRSLESGPSNIWLSKEKILIDYKEFIKKKSSYNHVFDIIILSAEAFIDHPSFGAAVIARLLQNQGYSVALICQPDPAEKEHFTLFNRPRLFFGVTAGNMDSLVRFYSPFLNPRKEDSYSENSIPLNVCYTPSAAYSGMLRRVWPGSFIVLGGIEASLRKACHFDFKKNSLRESILAFSGADLLVYGNGESQVIAIAHILNEIENKKTSHNTQRPDQSTLLKKLFSIPGTAFLLTKKQSRPAFDSSFLNQARTLPSFNEIKSRPFLLLKAFKMIQQAMDTGRHSLKQMQAKNMLYINFPALPLDPQSLDSLYSLPFTRLAAPNYTGTVKALEMIQNSVTSHRGCYGSCSFCAIGVHQGRKIISRSNESILNEINTISQSPGFKGTISDIGGPSANMFGSGCNKLKNSNARCTDRTCIGSRGICPHLQTRQKDYENLLKNGLKIKKIKKIFVSSGLRFDLLLHNTEGLSLFRYILGHCTSGIFKTAPEHVDPHVLALANKPDNSLFQKFSALFESLKKEMNLNYFTLPYMITSLPGADKNADTALVEYIRKHFGIIEQIQTFTPTPGTLAAAMWFAQCDEKGNKIDVIKDKNQRKKIRELFLNTNKTKNRPEKTDKSRSNKKAEPNKKPESIKKSGSSLKKRTKHR
jgi:uncharacterized radical SAM protein YgiQ